VHKEHAVTFAEAHDCTASHVWGGGAVRFLGKSTDNVVSDVDGVVVGATNNKATANGGGMSRTNDDIFNPIDNFNIPAEHLTVGILYNNPCNVKRYEAWQGEIDRQNAPSWMQAYRRPDMLLFKSPVWGIRCAAHLLQVYQARHGLNSVEAIINRWAPSSGKGADNTLAQTGNYVRHVSAKLGVSAKETIAVRDYETMYRIVVAMIEVENGGLVPYSAAQINDGLLISGIKMPEETQPEGKPATQSAERKGAVAVGVGGAGGVAASVAGATGMTQEEAKKVVNASGEVVKQVAAQGNQLDWVFWLLLFQSICWIAVIAGGVWWFLGRQRAGKMGLR
jgi:hypothetical protein